MKSMTNRLMLAVLAVPLCALAAQSAPHREAPAMEKSAFLGVVTAPIPPLLGSQINLPRGIGISVEEVDPDSPSQKVLKRNDVLHKINDQLLVSPEQLAVLVRSMKPGDEVKLTFIRGGKSQTETVKLAERELPPLEVGMPSMMPGFGNMPMPVDPDQIQEHARRMMERMQGGQMNNDDDWVPTLPRGRKGLMKPPADDGKDVKVEKHSSFSTMQTMKEGDLTVTLSNNNGDKHLLAKKENGDVVFDGPINSDKEMEKVPANLKKIVRQWENSVKIQVSPNGTKVESHIRSGPSNPDDVL